MRDIGLAQQRIVERAAVEDDAALEIVGDLQGARGVRLDHLHRRTAHPLFEGARNVDADIAAARDDDAAGRRLVASENRQGAVELVLFRRDIDEISGGDAVEAAGGKNPLAALDADDARAQIREQLGELAQRRIDDGAIVTAFDRGDDELVVGEAHRVGGTRHGETPKHGFGDFELGRDHDVDRQMLTGKQLRPLRREVILGADARDLGRDVEEAVRDLAGDDVDLVGLRDRDQHVGLLDAGLRQHVRVRAVADEAANLEAVRDRLDRGAAGCR